MFLATALCFCGSLEGEKLLPIPHTFTSSDGRTLRSMILSKTETSIRVLRADDGRQFSLSLENLSAEDQALVSEWQAPKENGPGDRALAFGRANLGGRVGKGECAHLAVESLKAAGAAPRGKDSPRRGDYVWGDLVAFIPAGKGAAEVTALLKKVKPGDLIQIYGARFKGKRSAGGTYFSNADHHTVMVEWVDSEDGGVIHILHQNVGGIRSVMRGSYKLADFKKGWLRVYRPVAAFP